MLRRGIATGLLVLAGLLGVPAPIAAADSLIGEGDPGRGGPMTPLPTPPPPPAPAPAPASVPAPVRPPSPPPPPPPVPVGLALAGAAALAGLTGTGSWLGYRQAKAGFALRASGTARFLP